MLICMKPTDKQLVDLRAKIAVAQARRGLTLTQLGQISGVHPSQAGRICAGHFKTFSHNVVQICNVLGVSVPRLQPDLDDVAPEWAAAQSSMRRLWDETPEGARTIQRLLKAIADLRSAGDGETS